MLVSALDQEIADFPGRAHYAHGRRCRRGCRDEAGKLRKIVVGCGTLEIRPPWVRDTDEPFRSQLLPRYHRASRPFGRWDPSSYLQGLATGDIELALRTVLGEAPR